MSDPEIPAVPEPKALACIVLSLGSPPELIGAVRSLQAQDAPVEIVVVNSGGGRPAEMLRDAGANVRLIDVEARLYAGGARNIGIAASAAPYVAFLAADCAAEPGWVSGRLRRHRNGALAVSSAITNPTPDSAVAWASYMLLFARRVPGTTDAKCLHYGVSYARTLFDRFGRFREDLRSGEDTDFNGRLAGAVPIQWAPEVRTAHRHPTSLSALLRDQYLRGARRVLAHLQASGRRRGAREALNAPIVAFLCVAWSWRAARPQDRKGIVRALPLVLPASIAYGVGALLHRLSGSRARAAADEPDAAGISVGARTREPRILALLTFHNEMRYLPDYFENVAPHVDGIVALDDGSVDGSAELAARQPGVVELLRIPPRTPHDWNEPRNQRMLIEAALRHRPDWLLATDADQRLERDFRCRAMKEIERAGREGHRAYSGRILELWDRPDRFRADGLWGRKRAAFLFKARHDHLFNDRPLHGPWAPADSREEGEFPEGDLIVYHLRMIHAEDRRARQERYTTLDPANRWQATGYGHLTDLSALHCRRLPRGRGYVPLYDSARSRAPRP